MTDQPDFTDAQARLDECERTVERLHKICCEPDRSPRMQQILSDIDTARSELNQAAVVGREVTKLLEDIGAQIGHLQVACCTDARMPHYKTALNSLAATQIAIATATGTGH